MDAAERSHPEARGRLLVVAVWVVALGLAAGQAWAYRHRINPDGISYLDLADAWREGRLRDVVSGHWSPAYPALIALARTVAPAREAELLVVRAVHLLAFAAALASLHHLLRTLRRTRDERLGPAPPGWAPLPGGLLTGAGLALGATILLRTTSLGLLTPDLLLVTPVWLATACVVRIVAGRAGLGTHALLGVALGVGYLTKSVLFPLSLVLLAAVALAVALRRGPVRRVAVSALAFALVAAPQVTALTQARGRFTFSDSSWLSVLWLQKGVPFVQWRGGTPPSAGSPDAPPRLLAEDPDVLEFATEAPWTYALWGDPVRWHVGADVRADPSTTLASLGRVGGELLSVLDAVLGLLTPVVLLFALRASQSGALAVLRRQWPLWLPLLAISGLYAPFHVEGRFLGGALGLFALAFLDGAALPAALGGRGVRVVGGFLVGLCALVAARGPALEAARTLASGPADDFFDVREALAREGLVDRGERVAVVGNGLRAYWARVSGLRIVADVLPPDDGATAWAADPVRLERVRAALAPAGVRFVFAGVDPDRAPPAPWSRIPGSGLARLDLR